MFGLWGMFQGSGDTFGANRGKTCHILRNHDHSERIRCHSYGSETVTAYGSEATTRGKV